METIENKTTVVNQGKNIAIIAYITIIGLVIAYVMNNDKKDTFAAYHIKQSLGLAATGLVLGIVGMVPILGWIINILGIIILLYMWVIGIMNAINEKESPVPILGEKYKEWLKNI